MYHNGKLDFYAAIHVRTCTCTVGVHVHVYVRVCTCARVTYGVTCLYVLFVLTNASLPDDDARRHCLTIEWRHTRTRSTHLCASPSFYRPLLGGRAPGSSKNQEDYFKSFWVVVEGSSLARARALWGPAVRSFGRRSLSVCCFPSLASRHAAAVPSSTGVIAVAVNTTIFAPYIVL